MLELENVVVEMRKTLEKAYDLLLKRGGFSENEVKEAYSGFEKIHAQVKPVIEADKKISTYTEARQKFIDEASFTLFNRLVGIKVMEIKGIISDTVVTTSVKTGGKSTAHFLYLSKHPEAYSTPGQGINEVLKEKFKELSRELKQLYGYNPYGVLPLGTDTIKVINLINKIPIDEWKKDDIIGWMYQYYNSEKRREIKDKKSKIDQNNIVYASQQYTPKWVIKYIVDNTLGRYYLEMYPNSKLYNELDVPISKEKLRKEREKRPLEDIRILDPACGSGNFLIYAFDLLYKMYKEQNYLEDDIPSLILKNNIYGVDIDDRAVQLTTLALYLKAFEHGKKHRKYTMNILSTDFHMFNGERLENILSKYEEGYVKDFIKDIWKKLKNSNVLGSLLNIRETLQKFKKKYEQSQPLFASTQKIDWKEKEFQILEDVKSSIEDEKIYGDNIKRGMNFAEVLIQDYDVVVSNPPYVDSSNMADDYKKIVKESYKGFDKNLYSIFIKRCGDFAKENGYVGMITPQTFMFISSYEGVRKWILDNFEIESLIHVGLGGVFEEVLVDTSIFILSRYNKDKSIFVKLDSYQKNGKEKNEMLTRAIKSLKERKFVNYVYEFDQSKFSEIPGSPFVYWISDEIRNLFKKYGPLGKYADVVVGLQTSDNDRFLRYWWEVNEDDISKDYRVDRKKWVMYAKGGPYNKWYGNLWWVVNWENDGEELKKFNGSVIRNESYYFREGLTYSFVSSLGFSVRFLPKNMIFDVGGSSLFYKESNTSQIMHLSSVLNSKLVQKIMKILNPTVNFQVGDLKNIPIPNPQTLDPELENLARENIESKKVLYTFHVIERDFIHDPISWALKELKGKVSEEKLVHEALKKFFAYKAKLEAKLLTNEAKIDEIVFRSYGLLPKSYSILDAVSSLESGSVPNDLKAVVEVLDSKGVSVGWYPYRELNDDERKELKNLYLSHRHDRGTGKSEAINGMEFGIVEEISKKMKLNPFTVAEEIEKIDDVPQEAVKDVIVEHLQAMIVEILREDEDGIVPLEGFTREKTLFDRLVQKWSALGVGDHYDDFEKFVKVDVKKYILTKFFKDHIKRFKNRPIVWHLSSDSKKFNFFVLHHKWNYDKLLALKSVYLYQIKVRLNTALSSKIDKKERDKLMELIEEIDKMAQKIEELSSANYRPTVDDGVAKNIAYLQKYGLIAGKVLNSNMLNKMLNSQRKG